MWTALRKSKIQNTNQNVIRTSNAVECMSKLKKIQVIIRPREGK